MEFKEIVNKIESIYNSAFFEKGHIVIPAEMEGYPCLEIHKDENGFYIRDVDAFFDICNDSYMYPVSNELFDKVVNDYGIKYSNARGYYLDINDNEEVIKTNIGKYMTFLSILVIYKWVGYFIYDESLETENEFLVDYTQESVSIDRALDLIVNNCHWGWILSYKNKGDYYLIETVLKDKDGNPLCFELKEINNKACVCVCDNYKEMSELSKIKSIRCLYLSSYDPNINCSLDLVSKYEETNISLLLAGVLSYLIIANNYKYFEYKNKA